MTATINITDAKAQFDEILRRVERGEAVTLARSGQPVATIAPAPRRRFGVLDGQLGKAPDFEAPLPESELSRWEGGR